MAGSNSRTARSATRGDHHRRDSFRKPGGRKRTSLGGGRTPGPLLVREEPSILDLPRTADRDGVECGPDCTTYNHHVTDSRGVKDSPAHRPGVLCPPRTSLMKGARHEGSTAAGRSMSRLTIEEIDDRRAEDRRGFSSASRRAASATATCTASTATSPRRCRWGWATRAPASSRRSGPVSAARRSATTSCSASGPTATNASPAARAASATARRSPRCAHSARSSMAPAA